MGLYCLRRRRRRRREAQQAQFAPPGGAGEFGQRSLYPEPLHPQPLMTNPIEKNAMHQSDLYSVSTAEEADPRFRDLPGDPQPQFARDAGPVAEMPAAIGKAPPKFADRGFAQDRDSDRFTHMTARPSGVWPPPPYEQPSRIKSIYDRFWRRPSTAQSADAHTVETSVSAPAPAGAARPQGPLADGAAAAYASSEPSYMPNDPTYINNYNSSSSGGGGTRPAPDPNAAQPTYMSSNVGTYELEDPRMPRFSMVSSLSSGWGDGSRIPSSVFPATDRQSQPPPPLPDPMPPYVAGLRPADTKGFV